MTLIDRDTEQRFLSWTDWEGYEHALEAFKNQRLKITYDQGRLELLTPSFSHEGIKSYLADLVKATFFHRQVDYRSGGSTTLRLKLAQRGLEPDECFFVSFLPRAETYDPSAGPWPDLALEVEVTRSALDRMAIFRALGVGEVWRYSADHQLRVEILTPEGYAMSEQSLVFPGLVCAELPRFVRMGLDEGPNAMLRAYQGWLADLV